MPLIGNPSAHLPNRLREALLQWSPEAVPIPRVAILASLVDSTAQLRQALMLSHTATWQQPQELARCPWASVHRQEEPPQLLTAQALLRQVITRLLSVVRVPQAVQIQ